MAQNSKAFLNQHTASTELLVFFRNARLSIPDSVTYFSLASSTCKDSTAFQDSTATWDQVFKNISLRVYFPCKLQHVRITSKCDPTRFYVMLSIEPKAFSVQSKHSSLSATFPSPFSF